jgi:hypothetical protein
MKRKGGEGEERARDAVRDGNPSPIGIILFLTYF